MISGRGFSTCLLCQGEDNLILGSEFIQNSIKICYNTDQVNEM